MADETPNDAAEAEEVAVPDDEADGLPSGAIAITALLAVIILVLWFGIYVIDLVRS